MNIFRKKKRWVWEEVWRPCHIIYGEGPRTESHCYKLVRVSVCVCVGESKSNSTLTLSTHPAVTQYAPLLPPLPLREQDLLTEKLFMHHQHLFLIPVGCLTWIKNKGLHRILAHYVRVLWWFSFPPILCKNKTNNGLFLVLVLCDKY